MIRNGFIVILISFIAWNSSFSQNLKIPNNYSFVNEGQCRMYEKNVLELIDWLSINPIDSNEVFRKGAILFINKWGKETPTLLLCPYTRISDPIFKDLRNKNKRKSYGIEIYMSYTNGMVKYIIGNPMSADLVKIQQVGIESLIEFYKKNPQIIFNSKAVEMYMGLQEAGELKEWIQNRINKKLINRYKKFLVGNLDKENLGYRDFKFD